MKEGISGRVALALIVLLACFGVAGGLEKLPQVEQENEALRAQLAAGVQSCSETMIAGVVE